MSAVALAIAGIDQATKAIAIANLQPGMSQNFLGTLVRFYLVYNDSAAFSFGFGQTWIFALLGMAALVALYWFLPKLNGWTWLLMAGVAAGGIAGNLFDRLFREPGFGRGLVVDFIQIPFNFPIFNIADSAIVFVALVLVIRVLLGHSPAKS